MQRPSKPHIRSVMWDYAYRHSEGEEYSLTRTGRHGSGLTLSISREKDGSVWDLVAETVGPDGEVNRTVTEKVDDGRILDRCSELMELSGFMLTFRRGYTMDDYRARMARWKHSTENRLRQATPER